MKTRFAIVGADKHCQVLLNAFAHRQDSSVSAVFPAAAKELTAVKKLCAAARIPVVNSWEDLVKHKPDMVFLCLPLPEIPAILADQGIELVSHRSTRAVCNLIEILWCRIGESEEARFKYWSALNAVTEGIQIMNKDGIIEHINPAFSKITGVHYSERVGKSVYDVSPDGAAVQVLRTGKSAIGVRNQAVGSCADVISNGAPIFIDGTLHGAVVVFQEVTDIIRLSLELNKSKAIIESLNAELGVAATKYAFEDLIGSNKKLLEAINLSKRAAKNEATILINGESGTGKEIIANAIHHAGPRWKKPLITVNCASLPDSLIESELFGHEKGAFTGAYKAKIGKFELADDGTIFLDEIGDLNFSVQAKLLRVLQEKKFERVGGNEEISVNVKILAATNKNLLEMVKKGLFREDLYYRLQVITVNLPPLRERKDDIPLLAEHLIRKICRNSSQPVPKLAPKSLELLQNYHWPGNIRELENCLTRAIMISDGKNLRPDDFHFMVNFTPADPSAQEEPIMPLDEAEKIMLKRALAKYGYSTAGKKAAAQALRISLGTLYYKIKHYNLDA